MGYEIVRSACEKRRLNYVKSWAEPSVYETGVRGSGVLLHLERAVERFLDRFLQMFQTLYGQTAAALYAKAAGQNAQARQLYNASADTYYKANDAAAYDDWVRARNHWDYFYNRS
eukprot:766012-Hanusia_phi.AAC.4